MARIVISFHHSRFLLKLSIAYSDIKRWEKKVTRNFTAKEQNRILVDRLTLGTFTLPAIACLGLAVAGISSTPLTVTGIFLGVETAVGLYHLRSTINRIRETHKDDILPDFKRQHLGIPTYYTPLSNTPSPTPFGGFC